ncbi:hypothetical protein CR513_18212, partial [Mucuna pruriens]
MNNIQFQENVFVTRGNQNQTIAEDGKFQPERLEPTPRGCSMGPQDNIPNSVRNIVFNKACHLLVEIEHRAYWELEKLRLEAYENSQIYKKKVKQFHDIRILRKEFIFGQKVLFFNSQLKLIACKLHSRWDRSFVITNVFPYGVVELRDEANNINFKVNGHQIKPYYEGLTPRGGEVKIGVPDEVKPTGTEVILAR